MVLLMNFKSVCIFWNMLVRMHKYVYTFTKLDMCMYHNDWVYMLNMILSNECAYFIPYVSMCM